MGGMMGGGESGGGGSSSLTNDQISKMSAGIKEGFQALGKGVGTQTPMPAAATTSGSSSLAGLAGSGTAMSAFSSGGGLVAPMVPPIPQFTIPVDEVPWWYPQNRRV